GYQTCAISSRSRRSGAHGSVRLWSIRCIVVVPTGNGPPGAGSATMRRPAAAGLAVRTARPQGMAAPTAPARPHPGVEVRITPVHREPHTSNDRPPADSIVTPEKDERSAPGTTSRQVECGVPVAEPVRTQRETGAVDRHDRPVLGPWHVRQTEHVPE